MQPLREEMLDPQARIDRREFVQPEHESVRIEQTWQRLSRPKPRRAWLWPAACGIATAACILLLVRPWDVQTESTWAGTSLRSGERASHVALADGSTIDAAPHTDLELRASNDREQRFSLRRGRARFDVADNPDRAFVVEAGHTQVRVKGTGVVVSRHREPGFDRVRVEVESGEAEVRAGARVRHLFAGDSWAVTEEHELTPRPVIDEAPEAAADKRSARKRRHRAKRKPRATAASLFESAASERREGNLKAAAGQYQSLLRRFPGDARTPLAAFELGRLRMDHLSDTRGAIRALTQALNSRSSSPFRQDAMARLVRAHDRLGNAAACRKAAAAYLKSYPMGRYAKDVEARCGE